MVVLKAPVVREIRLPVAVHLMTALQPRGLPGTRAIRTCLAPFETGGRLPQSTVLTQAKDEETIALFEAANDIWRQARIRFELDKENIVRETYTFRDECEVDQAEFEILLQKCAYPNAVNVFFFASLGGGSEADPGGIGLSLEHNGIAGCAMSDGIKLPGFTPPVIKKHTTEEKVIILAHELGHFLSLTHAKETAANAGRLMLPVEKPENRRLSHTKGDDEVEKVRASREAAFECIPLKLRVNGAKRFGGNLSHEFVVSTTPSRLVTVDAVISDALVAPGIGTLTMEGGDPGANDRQRTVNAATAIPRPTDIVATYTPMGGADAVTTRVAIHVVTFRMIVLFKEDGNDKQVEVTSSRKVFIRRQPDPKAVVTVTVQIDPEPACIPSNLVAWQNGTETADPLGRTVPQNPIASTTVTATVADATRSVTIVIVEVALTTNVAPFAATVAQVQIEGVLNADRTSFDKGDLFGGQANSLFRARADLPAIVDNTIKATLISTAPGGDDIERVGIDLTRTAGDRFVSLPLLAILAIFRIPSELKLKEPRDLEVVRAKAGGKMRLQLDTSLGLGGLGVAEVPVRGRVLYLFAQALANSASGISSGITLPDLQRKIARASRIWAQAGIEVKNRRITAPVEVPAELLDVEHTDNTGIRLTEEEKRLVGRIVRAGDPTRSNIATDLNVFYVRSLDRPPPPAADPAGIAYPNDPVIIAEGPTTKDEALAHEIGHQIIDWGGRDEHKDLTGAGWPTTNVLHQFDTGGGEVDRSQVLDILNSTSAGTNRFVIFEP